jgi:hypothetical protein
MFKYSSFVKPLEQLKATVEKRREEAQKQKELDAQKVAEESDSSDSESDEEEEEGDNMVTVATTTTTTSTTPSQPDKPIPALVAPAIEVNRQWRT